VNENVSAERIFGGVCAGLLPLQYSQIVWLRADTKRAG
jgi:hypothetical protein